MNLKKLSVVQIKKLCTAEQFAALNESELIEMFRYINNRILNLQGSPKLADVIERKWWECANTLLDKEICSRGICLTYVGFAPGAEGETVLEMLNSGESGIEDAYAVLELMNAQQLKNVETSVAKVVSQKPHLYQPFLNHLRQALQPLNGIMLN